MPTFNEHNEHLVPDSWAIISATVFKIFEFSLTVISELSLLFRLLSFVEFSVKLLNVVLPLDEEFEFSISMQEWLFNSFNVSKNFFFLYFIMTNKASSSN